MKQITEAVNGYVQGVKQSMDVKVQAVDFIRKNYLQGSKVYDEAMKAVDLTFNDAVKPLKEKYRETVKTVLQGQRERVQSIVAVRGFSRDALKFQAIVGSMSDYEKEAVLKQFENDYWGSKLLHDSMGIPFTTADAVIEQLNELETQLNRVTSSGVDSYQVNLMKSGHWADKTFNVVESFVEKFGRKEGDSND